MGLSGEEKCVACGQPVGTGTLLDFQPNVPEGGIEVGCSLATWQAFAVRYKCPVCVANEQEWKA